MAGYSMADLDYLQDNLGKESIKTIARKLGKSPRNLDNYRRSKGLPSSRQSVDGVSVTEFAAAVGRCAESIYDWVGNLKLPVKKFPIGATGRKEVFIDLNKFWDWAKKHRYFLDFSKIEKGILGKEPDWVRDQRILDSTDWGKKGWDRPWTKEEDTKLKNLLSTHKYTYRQLSDALRRTELSIQNRLYIIDFKLRPIAEPRKKWTSEDEERLKLLINEGYNLFQISRILNCSELQVKSKLFRLKGGKLNE